jgi:hypothetical protein
MHGEFLEAAINVYIFFGHCVIAYKQNKPRHIFRTALAFEANKPVLSNEEQI